MSMFHHWSNLVTLPLKVFEHPCPTTGETRGASEEKNSSTCHSSGTKFTDREPKFTKVKEDLPLEKYRDHR